jgi:indolepyruvate decarboxylase
MQGSYTVADYLVDRLSECGIAHIFGVPGDYNLQFLDHIVAHPHLSWVGCANELNAAYAADGYARARGAAALVTTFGVGELSALNGVAGSCAEYLPVIHIVGAPCLKTQRAGDLVHHTLGDGEFQRFQRMSAEITCSQALLTPENACREIDRVLHDMLTQRKPGYLQLPADVAKISVQPPVNVITPTLPPAHPEQLDALRNALRDKIRGSHRVALLADFLAQRFGAQPVLQAWMDENPLPHASLIMGKGLFDETNPGFVGLYCGKSSTLRVLHAIEEADLVFCVGVKFIDTITCGFSQNLTLEQTVDVQPDAVRIDEQWFHGIPMSTTLTILQQLCRTDLPRQPVIPAPEPRVPRQLGLLDQDALWRVVQDALKPGDIVIADQGTASFGVASLVLPHGAKMVVQPLWGSIGFALPAAYGVQTALPGRRVIVIIGDGAAQLTIQELGSMLRDGLKPIILLLNNRGYTVERAIHGAEQPYNDIAQWNWTHLAQAMSESCQAQSWRVSEAVQLQSVLETASCANRLSFIEVMLPQNDLPVLLSAVTTSLEQRNNPS